MGVSTRVVSPVCHTLSTYIWLMLKTKTCDCFINSQWACNQSRCGIYVDKFFYAVTEASEIMKVNLVFFIQRCDRSMSLQEFVVVWKLPALTGEELDELFKIAWILLGILIVCCCFLLLLEVASGSSVCRYSWNHAVTKSVRQKLLWIKNDK